MDTEIFVAVYNITYCWSNSECSQVYGIIPVNTSHAYLPTFPTHTKLYRECQYGKPYYVHVDRNICNNVQCLMVGLKPLTGAICKSCLWALILTASIFILGVIAMIIFWNNGTNKKNNYEQTEPLEEIL